MRRKGEKETEHPFVSQENFQLEERGKEDGKEEEEEEEEIRSGFLSGAHFDFGRGRSAVEV